MTTSTYRYEDFVPYLVEKFPLLRQLHGEHLRNNGSVLPHVLFGDITRLLTREFAQMPGRGEHRQDEALRLLGTLEDAFQLGDDRVKDLLVVSFLENLLPVPGESDGVVRELGPNLRRALDAIMNWRPGKGA